MALDHALAATLASGEGILRLYGWRHPTVSFGKNEPAVRRGADRLGAQHVATGASPSHPEYVRRPTGGRAVLHDNEVTYAVIAPVDGFGGVREAYREINRALADALRSLGAGVDLAGPNGSARRGPLPPDAGPCFQTPAAGEVVAAGRKLVGSAQARMGKALLQHGSILLAGSQRFLGSDGPDPTTLVELLGEVSRSEVTAAVAEALPARFGGQWEDGEYRVEELDAAERLVSERYALDTWTWRR